LTWSFLEAKIGEKIRLKRSLKNARQQKNWKFNGTSNNKN
jgi:hypothetical protein